MLIKAQKEITKISDDDSLNTANYLESLNYISNLYLFINKIKLFVSAKDIVFLPSFIGKYTAEKLRLEINEKQSEMKVFKVESPLFLEDKIYLNIEKNFAPICDSIERNKDTIIFIMR